MKRTKKIAVCLILMMALFVPGVVLATEETDLNVSTETAIVEIVGGNQYSSIQEAIADIEDNSTVTTIKLLTNVTEGAGFKLPEGSNIIFDFNGMTYNVTEPLVGSKNTETNGCQLLKNSTVVLKNGTFTSASAKILVQNYSNLTLQDITLDTSASEINDYVMSNNNGTVKIQGNTSIKGNNVAFDVCWAPNKEYPNGAQVTVNTTGTITGDIEIGTWGTINDSDKTNVKSTLTINNMNHDGKIDITQDYLKGQLIVNGGAYTDLATAIAGIANNSQESTTIKLYKDVTEGAGFVVPEGSNITIDFNGKTYNVTEPLVGSTGTQTLACQLLKNSTIEFKNGTFTSGTAKMLVQNYSNLTLTDMILDATASAENSYVLSNNNGKVSIEGNTSIKGNKVAFDVCWAPNKGYPNGTQVTVDTTGTIKGDIEVGIWGTINDSNKTDIKSTLTINNINHNGSINVTQDYLNNQLTINGGVYTEDVSDYLSEGLFCPQVAGEYIVKSSAKHKITVKQTEGGKVEVDKESAQYGETVKVTVTVNEGYKLVSLDCGDEGMGGDIIGQDSFIMLFDGDVTITPVFEKTSQEVATQEAVIPDSVANAEEVEKVLVETLKEVAKTNPELAKAIENNDVKIEVKLNDKVEVSSEDKKEIEETAKKEVADIKIAKYIDITVSVINKEDGKLIDNLPKLNEKITFTVAIPEDLPKVAEGYTRIYYIVREHDGDIDVWEAKAKDGKLEFSSDKFSTYAIAYKDVEATGSAREEKENPTTGDNIVLYVVTLVVAIAGIATITIIKKRNSLKK